MAEAAGVVFRFNTSVDRLFYEGKKIYDVKCDEEVVKADVYVMTFGSCSTGLLKGIVDIPVYPLKGYSLTIPVAQEDGEPVSTILDETYKIAITRFEQRIRVDGMAEIVGFNTELLQPRRETLEMIVRDLFPCGGNVEQAIFWTGLRPSNDARRYAELDNDLWLREITQRSDDRKHASYCRERSERGALSVQFHTCPCLASSRCT